MFRPITPFRPLYRLNLYDNGQRGLKRRDLPVGRRHGNLRRQSELYITPSSGYQVAAVTVDGTSVGAVPSYKFSSVSANHTISATFTALTYTITGSAGSNGSISPSGAATVTYGGSQSYTITPSSGYQVAAVTVDGTSVGAVSSYKFSSVSANHTISATFTALTYTITGSAGSNGTIFLGRRHGNLWRQSELYHHAFFWLPGGGGYGGRDLGWRGTELQVLQCFGQSHHIGHIYRLNLYDNG